MDTSWYFEKFGRSIGPISMYELECAGGEHRLTDCSYIHNKNLITHTNDWSITCKNGKIVEISVANNNYYENIVHTLICLDGPQSGDVRLYQFIYRPNYSNGRVEVYLLGKWGTVTTPWTQENAEVVCRQLYGYNSHAGKHFCVYM